MPSDPNSKTRVRIAFLSLFVVFLAGAYFVGDLGKLQENISARESRTALQGISDPKQIEEALRHHPSNKFLQMTAMATRAADETSAATEKLLNEVEPPAISKNINVGAASRADLEALRRDLKTAQANAAALMPRFSALLKTERDNVKKYALSLQMKQDIVTGLLDNIDKRHAEITAFTSKTLSARADYYRAYENYIAFLAGEFGTYKVVGGQFIFPFQRTVDRYNAAANAMTAASRQIAELEEEKKSLMKSGQERWIQFVNGL
jgi:hypothetical protein